MNSGKRVVRNTFVMYIQLLLNVLIGFYSVRVLLSALGEVDYGVYDVIGGIVGLLSFISNSLSQSSMRFISVSLGKRDDNETSEVFSSCVWMHLIIAAILCLILEIVGFFIFDGFLRIPQERIQVARIVYQCMILSLFIKVNSSPISALICSYEHFGYKAIVSITESMLKLVIALVVAQSPKDKLFLYGVLIVMVTIVNYALYFIYSRIRFSNVFKLRKPERSRLRGVGSFAGWTMMDTFSSVINRQGYAIMLNKFFGPIMNSAFAVSRQLEGHIFTISAAVVNSMKPQIMKSQGAGDEVRMFRLSLTAGKFGFYLMSLVTIPLLVMMPEVLNLWLKSVPEHTVAFSRLLVIACMGEQLTRGLVHANQAVGNIKWFSIIVSSLRILAMPLSCIALFLKSSAETAILIFVFCEFLGSFSRAIVLSKISNFRVSFFMKDVMVKVIPPVFVSSLFCFYLYSLKNGLLWMCATTILTAVVLCCIVYTMGLTKDEKIFIKQLLASFFNKCLGK